MTALRAVAYSRMSTADQDASIPRPQEGAALACARAGLKSCGPSRMLPSRAARLTGGPARPLYRPKWKMQTPVGDLMTPSFARTRIA